MQFKGLTLDDFQIRSIEAIDKNHSVVVSAPTGSGKTLIADYIIDRDIKKNIRVIYTAPIKALSNQKFKDFSAEYGKENVGLITGDIVKNPTAKIVIMTTEIYRNMAIIDDQSLAGVRYVVFDEIHYINDVERGYVWEESIIFSQDHIRFLCLSATIPNAKEFSDWITSIKNHEVETIIHHKRNVPLSHKFFDIELGMTSLKEIQRIADIPSYRYVKGKRKKRRPRVPPPNHIELVREIKQKTPCLFFNFSRKACEKKAQELAKEEIFKHDSHIQAYIRKKLEGTLPEISQLKTTQLLRRTLPQGIGFHHAGLLPVLKEIVEELFAKGKINVLYTTETFAVGINMPAKTVCFDSLRKFDGINFRYLNSKEYFQMAGRAGRRGIDKEGLAISMIYRPTFDFRKIRAITTKDIIPIKSQFKLSTNTVLNLLIRHSQEEINVILKQSFLSYQRAKRGGDLTHSVQATYEKRLKRLRKIGYVEKVTLTEKGRFASHLFVDEIYLTEIFATEFFKGLDICDILLLLACLVYESSDKDEFYKTFDGKKTAKLRNKIKNTPVLNRVKRFKNLRSLTALISPLFKEQTFFDVLKNTNLTEGDLIRFYGQLMDRLGQLKKAAPYQMQHAYLEEKVNKSLDLIKNTLEGIAYID